MSQLGGNNKGQQQLEKDKKINSAQLLMAKMQKQIAKRFKEDKIAVEKHNDELVSSNSSVDSDDINSEENKN